MPWRGSSLDGMRVQVDSGCGSQLFLTMSCLEAEGGYGSMGGELREQRGLEAGMGWLGPQGDWGETLALEARKQSRFSSEIVWVTGIWPSQGGG